MTKGPTVSICIPTFNRARWLEESVTSCLRQSYDDIEIVVSDNASMHETATVVQAIDDSRLRYHRHRTPVSPAENWNSSWSAVKGTFISLLCDDDALEPDFVLSIAKVRHCSGRWRA